MSASSDRGAIASFTSSPTRLPLSGDLLDAFFHPPQTFVAIAFVRAERRRGPPLPDLSLSFLRGLRLDAYRISLNLSNSATRSRISPDIGPIFGEARTSVVSTLTMRYPAVCTSSTARLSEEFGRSAVTFHRGSCLAEKSSRHAPRRSRPERGR